MSGHEERRVRVRLDGLLTEDQLEIVCDIVFGALIGCAGDLKVLNKMPDPKGAIREVAALARLSYWLEMGEMHVPDRLARKVMSRLPTEIDGMNERAETTGGDPAAEHEAMWAFVNLLSNWPVAAEVEDPPRVRRALVDSNAGGGK
ncbi:MAG: hypothetical protein JSS68_05790 [Actinobacteria bacterium]|nr:hypothetical protein [Actinomycetota bacterium]